MSFTKTLSPRRSVYAADDGDVITVANFGSAILDLPIPASSASDADRVFVTNTEKIAPLGTEAFVSLSLRPLTSKEAAADEATSMNDDGAAKDGDGGDRQMSGF